MQAAYHIENFVEVCRDYAKNSKLHVETDEEYFARHAVFGQCGERERLSGPAAPGLFAPPTSNPRRAWISFVQRRATQACQAVPEWHADHARESDDDSQKSLGEDW